MNAQELRLGNYIKYKGEHAVVTPNVILAVFRGSANYTPINLVPEIIEKCGFVKIENRERYGWYFDIDNRVSICWYYSSKISIEFSVTDGIYTVLDIECSHLHQLQNLIFALTQTELTIQL